MSISRWLAVGCVLGSIAIGALSRAAPDDQKAPSKTDRAVDQPAATEENNKAFHDELLKIAAEYKTYGRVDDETRWAPWLCRMPMPSVARFSKSDEEESHGQKLYYLFAKDRFAYIGLGTKAKPAVRRVDTKDVDLGSKSESKSTTRQVVVKESWHPKETDRKLSKQIWKDQKHDPILKKTESDPTADRDQKAKPGFLGFGSRGSYYPYAKKGDKTYHADKLAGLYIMYKTDAKSPGTDRGWVYGTVTSDGKTVTSAGRVASCMACHEEAPHDRLFGMHGK